MNSPKFHPDAQKELEAAEAYYDGRLTGLGRAFLLEVRRTVLRIAEQLAAFLMPFITPNFSGQIWIAAVARGRRRPGYWMKRKFGGPA